MKQFLFARNLADADNAVIAIPYDRIRSIGVTGTTTCKINFVGDDEAAGSITFSFTAGKARDVIKAIVNAQRASRNYIVNMGNEIAKTYLHANITAIGAIAHDA